MVKQRKVSVEGRNCLAVFAYSAVRGCRRKRLARKKALKKMLAPRRSGPLSPEEIDGGADAEDAEARGNRTGTCTPSSRAPGTYDTDDRAQEFLSTGRTGRRNALTDILGRHAETGMLDLPDRFEELSVETDKSRNSGQDTDSPGTSKQQG